MINYLIVPGLGNSREDHWQTYFENSGDNFYRINQLDWETPKCTDWIRTIDKRVLEFDLSTVVLIGIPLEQLYFKSIVVASANDPWVSLERAKLFAECWGSDFINIGEAGHINIASGHTNWDEGIRILQSLI